MDNCPDFRALVEFSEGLLPEREEHEIGNHLMEGCVTCRRKVAGVEENTDFLIAKLEEKVEGGLEGVESAFTDKLLERLRRIMTVPMDLHMTFPVLLPVRSSRGEAERSLVFSGNGYFVHLMISGVAGGSAFSVRGRIVAGGEVEGGTGMGDVGVVLLDTARTIESSQTDRFGRFKMAIPFELNWDNVLLKLWPTDDMELVIRLDRDYLAELSP